MNVESCLDYKNFSYESHEFDNVPPVVPRYNVHLEKYVKGLSETCNEFNNREHINDLRKYTEKEFIRHMHELELTKEIDEREKSEMTKEIDQNYLKFLALKGDFERY